jgi:hypothetical protein
VFRRHLPIPLVTVEWSVNAQFELGPTSAERLVQLSGGDLMWQKERLLCHAVGHLPRECDAVAVLDCDVVLPDPEVFSQARRCITTTPLIQPFDRAYQLADGASIDGVAPAAMWPARPSFAYVRAHGLLTPETLRTGRLPGDDAPLHTGYAWVAARSLLERHGIYDAAIIGGGDRDVAYAAAGTITELLDGRPRTTSQRRHLLGWARPFHADTQGKIGYVSGSLFHL